MLRIQGATLNETSPIAIGQTVGIIIDFKITSVHGGKVRNLQLQDRATWFKL